MAGHRAVPGGAPAWPAGPAGSRTCSVWDSPCAWGPRQGGTPHSSRKRSQHPVLMVPPVGRGDQDDLWAPLTRPGFLLPVRVPAGVGREGLGRVQVRFPETPWVLSPRQAVTRSPQGHLGFVPQELTLPGEGGSVFPPASCPALPSQPPPSWGRGWGGGALVVCTEDPSGCSDPIRNSGFSPPTPSPIL